MYPPTETYIVTSGFKNFKSLQESLRYLYKTGRFWEEYYYEVLPTLMDDDRIVCGQEELGNNNAFLNFILNNKLQFIKMVNNGTISLKYPVRLPLTPNTMTITAIMLSKTIMNNMFNIQFVDAVLAGI